MRDYLLFFFVIGMLPICFYAPRIGLMMWAWTGYMVPGALTWGFAQNFRFTFWTSLVTILGILWSREIKLRIPWNLATFAWTSLVFWYGFSTFYALNLKASSELGRTLKIQAMIGATLMMIRDRRWINIMVGIIVLSFGFWGVKGGVFTLLHGGAWRVQGPPRSFIIDNNSFALAILMTLPLIRYLQLQSTHKLVRLLYAGTMGLCYLATIGTYSRGGLVGLAVVTGMIWLKGRQRIITLIVLSLAVPAFLNFMPAKWQERMATIHTYQIPKAEVGSEPIKKLAKEEKDKSVSGRFNSWQFAINLANARPWIGGGFKAFSPKNFLKWAPNPADFHDAHSIYFQVLAEHGYMGLFLFLFFHITAFRCGTYVLRHTHGRTDLLWTRDLTAMIHVSMLGYAASGTFLGMAYFDLPYNLSILLIILKLVVLRETSGSSQPEPTLSSGSKPAEPRFQSIFDPPSSALPQPVQSDRTVASPAERDAASDRPPPSIFT